MPNICVCRPPNIRSIHADNASMLDCYSYTPLPSAAPPRTDVETMLLLSRRVRFGLCTPIQRSSLFFQSISLLNPSHRRNTSVTLSTLHAQSPAIIRAHEMSPTTLIEFPRLEEPVLISRVMMMSSEILSETIIAKSVQIHEVLQSGGPTSIVSSVESRIDVNIDCVVRRR